MALANQRIEKLRKAIMRAKDGAYIQAYTEKAQSPRWHDLTRSLDADDKLA